MQSDEPKFLGAEWQGVSSDIPHTEKAIYERESITLIKDVMNVFLKHSAEMDETQRMDPLLTFRCHMNAVSNIAANEAVSWLAMLNLIPDDDDSIRAAVREIALPLDTALHALVQTAVKKAI